MDTKTAELFARLLVADWRRVYQYERPCTVYAPEGAYNLRRITDVEIIQHAIAKYQRVPRYFWYFINRQRARYGRTAFPLINSFLDDCEAYMNAHGIPMVQAQDPRENIPA